MERRDVIAVWSFVLLAVAGTVFFIRHTVAPPQFSFPALALPQMPTEPAPFGKVIFERSLTPTEVVAATQLLAGVKPSDIPHGWQTVVITKTWGRTVDGLNDDVMVVMLTDGSWRTVESGPPRESGPWKGEEARQRSEEDFRNRRVIATIFCPGDLIVLDPAAYPAPVGGSKWYFQDGRYKIIRKHAVPATVLSGK